MTTGISRKEYFVETKPMAESMVSANSGSEERLARGAKRFSSNMAGHPKAAQAQSALSSLDPEVMKTVLNKAFQSLSSASTDPQQKRLSPDSPQLTAPKSGTGNDSQLSASSRLNSLLMQMANMINDSSVSGVLAKLQVFTATMTGNKEAYAKLANSLDQQGEQWGQDNVALTEAKKQADELKQQCNNAQGALTEAEAALAELQKQADRQQQETGSVSTEMQKQLDDAQRNVANAKTNVVNSHQKYNNFVTITLNPAIAAEEKSKAVLEQTKAQAEKLISNISPQMLHVLDSQHNNQDSKSLTFLMALIAQLINESASDNLENSSKLKQVQQQAAAKDAEKKAKEYEEEVRKAEEMEKTMGCIGKIFGWLITAISVVAAAFTGGASLALAAVGLALAVGDEISQAVSGFSFMQEALKPIMDGIIKPLMEMLGNMFTEMLKAFGVDDATAKQVGQIMGAVVAAVAMIAAVVVAGNLMSKVATKMIDALKNVMGDTMRNIMQKLMNSAVGQVLKRMSSGMGKSLGMSEAKSAQYATRLNMVETGASLTKATVLVAGDIVTAQMMVEAKKIEAKLMENLAIQELLNQLLEKAVESFKTLMSTVNTVMDDMSNVADQQYQAGKYITKNMARVAG